MVEPRIFGPLNHVEFMVWGFNYVVTTDFGDFHGFFGTRRIEEKIGKKYFDTDLR
jgi:hypothetical protein